MVVSKSITYARTPEHSTNGCWIRIHFCFNRSQRYCTRQHSRMTVVYNCRNHASIKWAASLLVQPHCHMKQTHSICHFFCHCVTQWQQSITHANNTLIWHTLPHHSLYKKIAFSLSLVPHLVTWIILRQHLEPLSSTLNTPPLSPLALPRLGKGHSALPSLDSRQLGMRTRNVLTLWSREWSCEWLREWLREQPRGCDEDADVEAQWSCTCYKYVIEGFLSR
jgi:hypothetical protein